MQRLLPAFGAVALLAATPAAAQDFPSIGGQYIDYGASMMAVGQMNNVLGSTVQRRSAPPKSSPRTPAAVPTRYQASPVVAARVRGQFADFVAKADPANGARLRQFIGQNDLLAAWAKHVSVDGLRRDDVADAMTAYWVQNWQIANKVSFVDRPRVQAVRAQVARTLGTSAAFARLGDAARQEMAESYMFNFVVQGAVFSDAMTRRDATLTGRLSDAAAARFRTMHVDLRNLRLTATGFES